MVLDRSTLRRRAVLATAGAGLSGLAGCNVGLLGETSPDPPPLGDETIRVGVLAPSNPIHDGEAIENGARMAAERINADGGIAGAGIELEVADTELSPDVAREEHRRLCEEEDCDLTVGLSLGTSVLEILESIAEQETVHLTTGSFDGRPGERTAEYYDDYRYHFRPGLPNYRDLADAVLEFVEANAADLGWERAALVSENLLELDPFHERIDDRLPEILDLPVSERSGLSTWSPFYNHVETEDCDVTFTGMALGGITAVNQWALQEREFALGGLHGLAMMPDYWERTEGNVEGVFTVDGLTRESDNTGRTRGFVDDYAARFGSVPAYSAATTYDALKLYRQAVESVVDADDAEFPDQEVVVEALEETTFTDGLLYDEFAFTGPDADLVHEPVWASMEESSVPVVQQWQADGDGDGDGGSGGQRVAIAPDRNRTAEYQRPPWFE